jgi:chaperonin GroEL (HSP60 family)
MNPMDLRRGILNAVDKVLEGLKELSVPIKGKEQIANVATISANGDRKIAELIANIFDKLGPQDINFAIYIIVPSQLLTARPLKLRLNMLKRIYLTILHY